MPADFVKCVKAKGKVITIKPKADTYINICYDKKGKAHAGEPKKVQQECEEEIAQILQEESSTANTTPNPSSEMGGVMRKVMPKGMEMSPKEKEQMKKKMKKANKKGKMVSEHEKTS